ncbi:MAG: nuclear transport factor 2 family protein [Candidatus Kariarchaeaceae archaeon]
MDDQEELLKLIDDIITYQTERDLDSFIKLYKTDSFLLGTGRIEVFSTLDQIRNAWKLTFDVDEIIIDKYEIKNLKHVNDVAWTTIIFDLTGSMDGVRFEYKSSRISMVFEKVNNQWLISQWHASFPQIGADESVGNWPTISKIQIAINELIDVLGLDHVLTDEKKAIMAYLIKAKSIADSITSNE